MKPPFERIHKSISGVGSRLRAEVEAARERAEELYGSAQHSSATDTDPIPIFSSPLPGEGWIKSTVPRSGKAGVPLIGTRRIVLSHVIWPSKYAIYTERDPNPYDISDPNLRRLKRRSATVHRASMANIAIIQDEVTINMQPFKRAYLPETVYTDIAHCIFGVSDVRGVRLLIDPVADEYNDLNGLVIPRNIAESQQDLAPAT